MFSLKTSVCDIKQFLCFPEVVLGTMLLVRHLKGMFNQIVHESKRFWHSEIMFKEKKGKKAKRQCVTFMLS
jgi:hypothetical protein